MQSGVYVQFYWSLEVAYSPWHYSKLAGTSPLDVRAVEVQIGANQLSSAGVFVLLTQTHTYKWMGSCSTEDSKTVADHLIQHLGEGRWDFAHRKTTTPATI